MIIKLKKIGVLKTGFVFALLYAFLAFIFMVGAGIFSGLFGQNFPWFMIILAPIFYSFGGFICGVLISSVYNLVSKWIGGLEFDVEKLEKFSE